jgi:hypothetical protein
VHWHHNSAPLKIAAKQTDIASSFSFFNNIVKLFPKKQHSGPAIAIYPKSCTRLLRKN